MKPFDTTVAFGLGPDAEFPFAATVDGARWVLRLNNFPAEQMWTLLIDDAEVITFDDWPKSWTKPDRGPPGIAPTTAPAAAPARAPVAAPTTAPTTAPAGRAFWRLELTPERLRAHRAWVEGGRKGAGRLVIEAKNLSDAPCSGAFLVAARLIGCDLSRINASQANLGEAELIDCVGDAMSLAQSAAQSLRVTGGRYLQVDMRLTRLDTAHIERTDWTDARLDRAGLTGARLEQVNLANAAVWDAVLDRATLTGCNLRGADLSKRNKVLRLCTTNATRFIDCDLRGVNFEGRHLANTVFERCRFHGATGKAVFDGPITVTAADFSAAGDCSDVRGEDAVRALLGG